MQSLYDKEKLLIKKLKIRFPLNFLIILNIINKFIIEQIAVGIFIANTVKSIKYIYGFLKIVWNTLAPSPHTVK